MTTIIGIKVSNRLSSAAEVQSILTKFGCVIRTRIGLHNEVEGKCSPDGIILLEITKERDALETAKALCDIDGIEIQQMKF